VVREIRTPRSVGTGGGLAAPGDPVMGNGVLALCPKLPRPSSTLP
jgi:hypothetical protein